MNTTLTGSEQMEPVNDRLVAIVGVQVVLALVALLPALFGLGISLLVFPIPLFVLFFGFLPGGLLLRGYLRILAGKTNGKAVEWGSLAFNAAPLLFFFFQADAGELLQNGMALALFALPVGQALLSCFALRAIHCR
jgi:hypothetical protein